MQCEECGDANSELFKEPHDEAMHKNSYESRLYELISASLTHYGKGRSKSCAPRKALIPPTESVPAEITTPVQLAAMLQAL